MADFFMYELEDIVWDEFGQSDDHIVPHPSDEFANEHAFQGDSRKKSRCEVTDFSSNAGDQYAAKYVTQEKEEREFLTLNKRRNTMLEKDKWSHVPDSVFSASYDGDSIKKVTNLTYDNTRMSRHCFKGSNIGSVGNELCADDPILSDRCTEVESNSYNLLPSHISQTDNDHNFFGNDSEDKESSDLLYYGWPDIGNFEDVDRMLRSCDSSFGLGGAVNEDELGWFSSSEAIEGSEDALKSGFKFSCPMANGLKDTSENHEPSKLNKEHFSIKDSRMESALASYNASSRPSGIDKPDTLGHLPFVNRSNQISENKVDFMSKEKRVEFKMSTINSSENDNRMINFHKKQPKHQNQSEGKIKDRCLEKGGSFHHIGNLQNKDVHLLSGDTSRQIFTSVGIRMEKQYLGPDSCGYSQTSIPYMHSDHFLPSDQNTVSPTLSVVKSENNSLRSLSPKESSHASNQVQPVEGTYDPLFEATASKLDDKREKRYARQGFQTSFTSSPKCVDVAVQSSICDPVSVQKRVYHYGNELENQSDVEGVSIGILAELGPSNVQESCSMNYGQNEISPEAISFHQLQQVVELLDLRTKLCIRDSLFRLARSAEQRHNSTNLNGGSRYDRDTSGALIAEVTNKSTGFIDMETDTNPIDRSIAHLLFHRPSDSSVTPAYNALSCKS